MKAINNMFANHAALILSVFLFSSLSALQLTADNYAFKVLASKGEIKLSKSGGDNWEKLKGRIELFDKDKLKIERGAYLGLVHSSGKTVELKDAGTYNVSDLVKSVSKKETSMSKRLTKYVFDEISQASDVLSSDDYHQAMGTTGSVERSVESTSVDGSTYFKTNAIIVNLPKKTDVILPQIQFGWEPISNAKDYTIIVRDRFDNEVFRTKSTQNIFILIAQDAKLDRDNYYFINVSISDNPGVKSEDFAFQIISDDKATKIKDEEQRLKQELNLESSLVDKIILASFYESNHLFIEAGNVYNDALGSSSDIEEFQNMYKVYLYKRKTGNY